MYPISLRLAPEEAAQIEIVRKVAARKAHVSEGDVAHCIIRRRSIDARQRNIYINLSVELYMRGESLPAPFRPNYQDVSNRPAAVVVGAGPAGLFAALRLIELGIRPIVLERGRDVHSRKRDLALLERGGEVNPESNYCFGEGGAGTFSDGKLYTRSTKRGSVERILGIFVHHGASRDILIDAHPHIGSDKLPIVIERMRQTIIDCGGSVSFETKVTELLIDQQERRVLGVRTAQGDVYEGAVLLATGHSARDMYRYLHSAGLQLEPKGTAIGVRLEHPQSLIDRIRYHNPRGRGDYLPAAEYTYSSQVDGRGVYSFCMCPGGFVVPAATAPGELIVNGMSPAGRGSRWANSGLVVEIRPEDLGLLTHANGQSTAEHDGSPLALLRYIEALERNAYQVVGGSLKAPAQRMIDFLSQTKSTDLPPSSYRPGLTPALIDEVLPPFITERMRQGFRTFDKQTRGFISAEAILIGIESRTSTPLRIPRDPAGRQHIDYRHLYPIGEGAGYAGGIVSAAMDGERSAEALALSIQEECNRPN